MLQLTSITCMGVAVILLAVGLLILTRVVWVLRQAIIDLLNAQRDIIKILRGKDKSDA